MVRGVCDINGTLQKPFTLTATSVQLQSAIFIQKIYILVKQPGEDRCSAGHHERHLQKPNELSEGVTAGTTGHQNDDLYRFFPQEIIGEMKSFV